MVWPLAIFIQSVLLLHYKNKEKNLMRVNTGTKSTKAMLKPTFNINTELSMAIFKPQLENPEAR